MEQWHEEIGDETKGRGSALALLNILDRHALPATWATVGNWSVPLDGGMTHEGSKR
jgi:hypothetical protein